jgi:hypothetical protein
MTADELTAETERKFKAVVEAHLRATGKPRFMNKQTANVQRIGVIDRMFPDAFFVHILRDGRAVANSLLRVDWWQATDVWWLGGKPEKWEQMGGDPLELCALQWRRDVEEILLNKNQFANRYLEIKYEELVQDTRGVVDKAVRFCGLGEDAAFRATIPETLPNMNQKWREQLDKSQQLVLENTIGDFLMELGYGP